jgi:4-amino-4-deoxy-L-arabinose transferase-like glycosyltransferase
MDAFKRMKRWFADRPFWFLCAAAFCFRLAFAFGFNRVVSFDEPHYLRLAGSFFERGAAGLLHPYWPPMYPACIALVSLVVPHLEPAGRIVNALASTLMVLLVFKMASALFRRKEAVLSALVVALSPPMAWSASTVMPDNLVALFGIGGMMAGWKALNRKSPWLFALTGFLWGAAYLTKPEGAGFVLVYAALLAALFFRKREWSWIGRGVILVVVFALVASPYLFFLRRTTGAWTLSTKGSVNQQLESAVLLETGGMKDPFFHLTSDNRHLPCDMAYHFGNIQKLAGMDEGRRHIVRLGLSDYAVKFAKNFYRLERTALPQMFGLTLFALFVLGFFGSPYQRDDRRWILYCSGFILFFWFMVVPLFHVNERYLQPLFPLMLVWIGRGMTVLTGWTFKVLSPSKPFSRRDRRFTETTAWILVLGFIAAFFFLPESAKVWSESRIDADQWGQPVELKEAGLWLKNRLGRPPVLMSLNKAVDFYAGQFDMRKGASFSYDDIDRNVAYAQFRDVDFLVCSSRYLGWFFNLKPLFESQSPSPYLERVYDKTGAAGIRTVIYRLVKRFNPDSPPQAGTNGR